MSTSLSQNVGKRTSGKLRTHARIEDINKRSQPRRYASTGSAYSVVNCANLIKIEFAQTGDRHDITRYAIVGELSPIGFKSYPVLTCEGLDLSWDELADLIGANPDRLMVSVLKFAHTQQYIECRVTSTKRYSTRAHNRQKCNRTNRAMKGVKVC